MAAVLYIGKPVAAASSGVSQILTRSTSLSSSFFLPNFCVVEILFMRVLAEKAKAAPLSQSCTHEHWLEKKTCVQLKCTVSEENKTFVFVVSLGKLLQGNVHIKQYNDAISTTGLYIHRFVRGIDVGESQKGNKNKCQKVFFWNCYSRKTGFFAIYLHIIHMRCTLYRCIGQVRIVIKFETFRFDAEWAFELGKVSSNCYKICMIEIFTIKRGWRISFLISRQTCRFTSKTLQICHQHSKRIYECEYMRMKV